MNITSPVPKFGSLGPPKGPRRTSIALNEARQKEISTMFDLLIDTVRLKEAPAKGKPGVFKITMGPKVNEYTVTLKPDTTFVATRNDGNVVIDLFHNTWERGMLSLGYTNKSNPDQSFVTPFSNMVAKGKALSAALKALITEPPSTPGLDI